MIKGLKHLKLQDPVSPRACQLNHPHLFLREQVQVAQLSCCPGPAPASALSLPLSRCCQTHDKCYSQAKKLDSCTFLLDNPYTKTYSYSCSGSEITCNSKLTPCWLIGPGQAWGDGIIVTIATILNWSFSWCQAVSPLTLATTLWDRYYYYPHFTAKATKAQKLSQLFKDTQVFGSLTGLYDSKATSLNCHAILLHYFIFKKLRTSIY